jgi:sugar phosphate isomerase/epimerase
MDSTAEDRHGESPLPLLELPKALAEHGYTAMQLCHFHIPSRSDSYLTELRGALAAAGVSLHALLIDEGDVTDPVHGKRDTAWMQEWVETAAKLGATHARVIAGKRPAQPQSMALAARRIHTLTEDTTVRIQTENWFDLLSTAAAVNDLLDRLDGSLGLCADFGNWPRPRKYADLPKIMPRAESCHAKFEFLTPDTLDQADADACLGIAREANFKGPYVLVNGGTGDSDWDGLAIQREAILSAL